LRAIWLGLTLLAIGQSWIWTEPLRAQSSETAPAEKAPDRSRSDSSQGVKRVEPEIFYVKDPKDPKGNLLPLLNVPLKELDAALDKTRGAVGAVRPAFRLDRMIVNGEVTGKHAALTFQFQITVFANHNKWVRVPLRLAGVALEKAEYQGEGERFLVFDEADGEYVSWFRCETETPHVLTLHGLVALDQSAGQTRLKLNAPRAVHSELTLKTASKQAVGEVSGAVLAETRRLEGGAEFKAIGLTSDFTLAWREPSRRAQESRVELDAQGEILVRIDHQNVISTADLTVGAFGREFDSFRVRLPPGAELITAEIPAERPDYSVAPLDAANDPAAPTPAGSWVEVKRTMKSAEPLKIRLKTQRALAETAPDKPFELAGFEVQGAARQWGDLAVFVANDWQISFGKRLGVRQVEDLANEAFLNLLKGAEDDELLAGFEYYFEYLRQPCSLPVLISPQETVISVAPYYLVRVSADQMHLDAKLAYKVSGAKAFGLEIDLPGWAVDATSITARIGGPGPAAAADAPRPELADVSRIAAKPGEPLTIPLKQAALGRVEVTLTAQRKIAEGAETVDFQLPRPEATTQDAAELAVLADQNIELTPRETDLAGLRRQPSGPELAIAPGETEPLYYRGEAEGAKFAADFRIRPRQVSVEVFTDASLSETGAVRAEQTFTYRIQYEPAETLTFEVPQVLVDERKFKAFQYEKEQVLDGELSWEPIAEENAAPDEAPEALTVRRVRVKLRKPALGACRLKIEYSWSGEPLMRETSVPLKLPLVMPAEVECRENRLDLSVDPGVKAEPLGAEWSPRPVLVSTSPGGSEGGPGALARQTSRELASGRAGAPAPPGPSLQLQAAQTWPALTLNASLAELSDDETMVVERVWLQTQLSKSERTDRAVYRFESRDHRFSLILPQGWMEASFWLDGALVEAQHGEAPNEQVIVWRDGGTEIQTHVLEAKYSFPDRPKGRGLLSLELPKLASGVGSRRAYWQLILPRDEYLVTGPGELTSEAVWSWDRYCWSRRPPFDQNYLDAWAHDDPQADQRAGAPASQAAPFPSANEYLFSSIEISGAQQVRTASRSSLVLIGSGLVLLAGLALIYAPALRHPALLFAAALAVLTGAMIYPEVTLLWLQAAAAGALLTAVAGVLERRVARRRRREAFVRGGSSSIVSRNSTRTHPRHSAASAPVSTETAAVALELSAPESRP